MPTLIHILIAVMSGAVALVLVAGFLNMAHPKAGSRTAINLSQKLMRWRIGLQFAAICLILAGFYFTRT